MINAVWFIFIVSFVFLLIERSSNKFSIKFDQAPRNFKKNPKCNCLWWTLWLVWFFQIRNSPSFDLSFFLKKRHRINCAHSAKEFSHYVIDLEQLRNDPNTKELNEMLFW